MGKVKLVKDSASIVAVAVDIEREMNREYCTLPDGMDKLWGIVMVSKNRLLIK